MVMLTSFIHVRHEHRLAQINCVCVAVHSSGYLLMHFCSIVSIARQSEQHISVRACQCVCAPVLNVVSSLSDWMLLPRLPPWCTASLVAT